ncbi:diguanylate cyclase [Gorillibacterium massiliense]|uniref:sensor domain-containing diguanylate cyclase n=1 Tax=Gorillibacterium massiliense TaxID=1280390 RepID=UPI0004BBA40A|nr:diguanylate cyclase [Gorillibacterium massiliense]
MQGDLGKQRGADEWHGIGGAVLPEAIWGEAVSINIDAVLRDSFMLWTEELRHTGYGDCRCFLQIGLLKASETLEDLKKHPTLYLPDFGTEDDAKTSRLMAEICIQSGKGSCDGRIAVWPVHLENGPTVAALGIFLSENANISELDFAVGFFSLCCRTVLDSRRAKELAEQMEREKQAGNKKDAVFHSVRKLITLIDVQLILSEVVYQIREYYPDAELSLLLSQDYRDGNLPVKPLNIFDVNNELCTRAFMEGRLIDSLSKEGRCSEVASPLAGKQGVYGVLHLHCESVGFSAVDLGFISMITTAAGTAFENARLYEQSNLLVGELRSINEITQRLNQSLKLQEIFQFALMELIRIFEAEYCCILQFEGDGSDYVVQASNIETMLGEVFSSEEGYVGIVCGTKEPVIVSDYLDQTAVKSRFMEMTESRSLLGTPIFMKGDVVGAILITHRFPNYFTYENYKLLFVLSGAIGLAIENASLHAEVKRMAITDNLTGLYTRRFLDEQVTLHQHSDECGAIIVVDIDDFKLINDTYGHQTGDRVLIQVSSIVRASIRDSDTAARWGGEELAVYIPQVGLQQAERVAERIRLKVKRETDPAVTVSCGIAEWREGDNLINPSELFYRADMGLYQAKREGKNQTRAN